MDSQTVSVKIGKDAYERVKALAEADYGRSIRSTIELLLDFAMSTSASVGERGFMEVKASTKTAGR